MVSDLAFALGARGESVWVITSRQRYEQPREHLRSRERIRGVEVRRIWTTRFGRVRLLGRAVDYLSFYWSAFFALLILARAGDVIVAKTDPPLISVVAWFAARLRGARLVNWLQDLFPEVAEELGVLRGTLWVSPLVRLRDRSLRAAQTNVVLGERMRQRLIAHGIAPDSLRVIPNWADGGQIHPVTPEENALRESWGVAGKFVVGYSGNLGRAHEFDTMLGAMKRFRGDDRVVFVLIGGGVGMAALARAVAAAGLPNVRFFPYQPRERLSESLSVADVHLISLRPQLEGLIVPSKIYGILAAGRPTVFIGDADGEVARLIAECRVGFTVPVGGVERLAECLRWLKDDPSLAEKMGRRARVCFERRYDVRHGVDCWHDVLREGRGDTLR